MFKIDLYETTNIKSYLKKLEFDDEGIKNITDKLNFRDVLKERNEFNNQVDILHNNIQRMVEVGMDERQIKTVVASNIGFLVNNSADSSELLEFKNIL